MHLPPLRHPGPQIGCPQWGPVYPYVHWHWLLTHFPPCMHLTVHFCSALSMLQAGFSLPSSHKHVLGALQRPLPHLPSSHTGLRHIFPVWDTAHPGQQNEEPFSRHTLGPVRLTPILLCLFLPCPPWCPWCLSPAMSCHLPNDCLSCPWVATTAKTRTNSDVTYDVIMLMFRGKRLACCTLSTHLKFC